MVLKLIDATEAKPGVTLMIDGLAYVVRNMDISKTGKHGASKVRFEAVGILDGKKKVVAVPGHERFEVPEIKKLKGQVLSVNNDKANIMDLETFETLDILIDEDLRNDLKENDNIEYWEIEGGAKIIKRKA